MTRGFIVLALVIAAGVIGYLLTGWSLLDSLYMVVITIFGVGYGEVRNIDSPELKVFTMLLIIAGCSALIYILGGFFQLIAEGELNRALGKLRMTKQINQLKEHVIVCGYGRIGRVLTSDLTKAGVSVVVVDQNESRCAAAAEEGLLTFEGDATQDDTLRQAGVDRARALCTVLPNDALNVFITLTARNLNPDLAILARGEDPQTEAKLRQAGAAQVVLPSRICGTRMADMVIRPAALDYLRRSDRTGLDNDLEALGLRMVSVVLDSTADGHIIGDLEASARVSLIVVALKKKSGEIIERPPLDEALSDGDTVILLVHSERASGLAIRFPNASRKLSYRGARVN